MAKRIDSVTVKGFLSLEEDTITEVTKDEELVYSFSEIIKGYDGKNITISIKEEQQLAVKEETEEE